MVGWAFRREWDVGWLGVVLPFSLRFPTSLRFRRMFV